MRVTRRAILRQHPEVRSGAWKDLPVPPDKPTPGGAECIRFSLNDRLSVQTYEQPTAWGRMLHLVIRPHDDVPLRSWYQLQRAKDHAAGSGATAIEVFPAAAALHDEGVAIFHLWVLPDGFELPFGLEPGKPAWGLP